MRKLSKLIGDEEADLLRYSLRLDNSVRGIKFALQTICVHYEAGRRLANSSDHRQAIHSHLNSKEIILRRWSLKALGLIGNPDDASRIVDRLRVEHDQEAQTWGTAALLGSSPDQDLNGIVARSGLTSSTPLLLAARLYARESWVRRYPDPPIISLSDDELTLKWAIFLIGYKKASANLFSDRHENNVFLGELNKHTSDEISEYSIWALHERPDYNFLDAKVRIDEIKDRPENVRKWLYRLLLKSQDSAQLRPDMLTELTWEGSASAKEGLAHGLNDLTGTLYNEAILDWYYRESEENIRDLLLIAMAKRANDNAEFAELVERSFVRESADSSLRRKLLAAGETTKIYPHLKRIALMDKMQREGLLQFGLGFDHRTDGGIIVNNTTTNINISGGVSAQNFVTGDMIGSANGAVQNLQANRSTDKEILSEIVSFLNSSKISDAAKQELAQKVKLVAEEPSDDNKQGLISTVKRIADAASITGTAIEGIDKIMDLVGGLLT
ncbi:hypothetical protein BHAOGJBA_2067 [Methylobacterium hispanicum]|uniref:HEAT repeat domain-containing protein n=1 Tax=Methylobacterium hispanicum TaxID=270350 RepID=A0AAV4ZK70_9HYPH|nr:MULTISPECIES: hypothetical protein [Methylobacterium]GJD88547.1 hypothetical protein BHAOGJBA_2067 [Methylobacterium hispanicum]